MLSRLIFKFDKNLGWNQREHKGGEEKTRGLAYIAGNGTKERYATCGLRYSNSEKREYFPAEAFSSTDPRTEVSETAAAAAVQESGKGRLSDGTNMGTGRR